ncbi:MAG: hypothetical protein N3B21_11565 [Clostridia bacterium]|nr:hypothetical protein [Clostridia bacterium]
MNKLNYCLDCRRIFDSDEECIYCKSQSIKALVKKAPINIIGTKLKGRVLTISQGIVQVLFTGEKRVKTIKQFEASKLKKLL